MPLGLHAWLPLLPLLCSHFHAELCTSPRASHWRSCSASQPCCSATAPLRRRATGEGAAGSHHNKGWKALAHSLLLGTSVSVHPTQAPCNRCLIEQSSQCWHALTACQVLGRCRLATGCRRPCCQFFLHRQPHSHSPRTGESAFLRLWWGGVGWVCSFA